MRLANCGDFLDGIAETDRVRLRTRGQTRGYLLLLTESYPYSGPVVAPERQL